MTGPQTEQAPQKIWRFMGDKLTQTSGSQPTNQSTAPLMMGVTEQRVFGKRRGTDSYGGQQTVTQALECIQRDIYKDFLQPNPDLVLQWARIYNTFTKVKPYKTGPA